MTKEEYEKHAPECDLVRAYTPQGTYAAPRCNKADCECLSVAFWINKYEAERSMNIMLTSKAFYYEWKWAAAESRASRAYDEQQRLWTTMNEMRNELRAKGMSTLEGK